MLVLSRRSGEAIMVGEAEGFEHQLKLTVLEVSGSTVRLGFEVDKSVPVHRWEVWERLSAGQASPARFSFELEDRILSAQRSDQRVCGAAKLTGGRATLNW